MNPQAPHSYGYGYGLPLHYYIYGGLCVGTALCLLVVVVAAIVMANVKRGDK
jgi:hypothetical protein